MDFELFLLILEYIGTIAFAISGAMIAIEHKMDILGVIILGSTTAVGGGLFRDIIIGKHMPSLFVYPWYALTAVITTIIIFILMLILRKKSIMITQSKIYQIGFNIIDSLGLGVFVVVGATETMNAGVTNHFLIIFCAVLTAVGGGMLRDIMAASIPAIFRKHIYCVAAIVGAVLYYLMYQFTNLYELAAILAIVLVVIIRFLAFYFKWNLPKIHIEEEN